METTSHERIVRHCVGIANEIAANAKPENQIDAMACCFALIAKTVWGLALPRALSITEEGEGERMSGKFLCGSSPIWEYPPDVPRHVADEISICNPETCPICTAQRQAQEDGRAKIVGTSTWSGYQQHGYLKRSLMDWILRRPGRWVYE